MLWPLYKAIHKNSKRPITLWLSNWTFQSLSWRNTLQMYSNIRTEEETMTCVYHMDSTIQQKETIDEHSNMMTLQWFMPRKKHLPWLYTIWFHVYNTFEMTTHTQTIRWKIEAIWIRLVNCISANILVVIPHYNFVRCYHRMKLEKRYRDLTILFLKAASAAIQMSK